MAAMKSPVYVRALYYLEARHIAEEVSDWLVWISARNMRVL